MVLSSEKREAALQRQKERGLGSSSNLEEEAPPLKVAKPNVSEKPTTTTPGSSSKATVLETAKGNSPPKATTTSHSAAPGAPQIPQPTYLLNFEQNKQVMGMKVAALQALQKAMQLDPGTKSSFEMRFECIKFCATSGEAVFDPDTPTFEFPDLKVQDFLPPAATTPSRSA